MRITRMHSLIIAALAAALLAIPMAASAGVPAAGTLKNNYGLQFAGQAKCISCHSVGYADTTHGKFSAEGVGGAPVPESGNIVSLGGATVPADSVFVTLGYGTGLREALTTFEDGQMFVPNTADPSKATTATPQSYIAVIAGLENFWTVKAGGVNVFDKWEYPNDASDPEFEAYCGGNCHNLGYTKGAPNAAAGLSSTLTNSFVVQGWAAPWSSADTSLTQYDLRTPGTDVMAGAGIQCENCHGTGTTAVSHWGTGVMINTQTPARTGSKPTAAEARPLLRSDVCGQCHGTYLKSNFLGYTPDKPLASFAATQVGAAQLPTEEQYAADVASYTADPAGYNGGALKYKQLWPRGINSGFMFEKTDGSTYQTGMKHVYFTEWSLTGHSFRSKLTSSSPDASMYQKSTTQNGLGGSGLSNATADYRDPKCGFCHAGEVYLKRKGDALVSGISTAPADVGFLGVECASCHVVHNAGTAKDGAVGMGLREPEAGNISICEDCHKERNTVMGVATGAPFAYDLSRTGAAGAGIGAAGAHAAQGTVLHGDGMVDVPKIEGFMSSVGCEKCHMPATRADFPDVGLERYADRSFKRYTHSMQIVEPGQYGAVAWQDSCSPCHPGMSQAKLKSYIEDQQTVGAQLIAETSAAIVAADARVNYTGSTVPSANKALLDRAFNNYTFAQAENSGGFHNPGYTQAGLRKAVKMANSVGGRIAHIQASSSLAAGGMGYVAGTVENGLGAMAAGESITLLRNGVAYGSATTDENGNFSFMIVGDVTRTYTAVWARCSDPIANLAAAVVVPVTNPAPTKIATSLTLSISKNSAHLRSGYVLSGAISPRFAGASIVITYRRPGSRTWRTWTTVKTTASGTYSIGTRGYSLGTYTYRATFPGDATHSVARYVYHSIRIVR